MEQASTSPATASDNNNANPPQSTSPSGGLSREWAEFVHIVFAPVPVVVGLLVVVFVCISVLAPAAGWQGRLFQATLALIITLLAGIVGAIMSDRWNKINNASVLRTRGTSAVRGLQLLYRNVGRLENRVKDQSSQSAQDGLPVDAAQASLLAEIRLQCLALQEQVTNAIEEWEDIVPEVANLRTKISIISDLKDKETLLLNEMQQVQQALEQERATSTSKSAEAATLQNKLRATEQELLDTREEQKRQQSGLAAWSFQARPTALGRRAANLASAAYVVPTIKCKHCGATFAQDQLLTSRMPSNTCPNCGKPLT